MAVAERIEQHFGPPQDIEWAYAEQTLWIVQARPMTALPPPPLHLNRVEQLQFGMMAELLPVRPYPVGHDDLGRPRPRPDPGPDGP